jgi:hypothetical protein
VSTSLNGGGKTPIGIGTPVSSFSDTFGAPTTSGYVVYGETSGRLEKSRGGVVDALLPSWAAADTLHASVSLSQGDDMVFVVSVTN